MTSRKPYVPPKLRRLSPDDPRVTVAALEELVLRESWWLRYARASLRRPYEHGFYAKFSWRVLLRQRRLAPLAFKLASVLDAKGDKWLRGDYPAVAKYLDEWGMILEWLGV